MNRFDLRVACAAAWFVGFFLFLLPAGAQPVPPFTVKAGLFDQAEPDSLGLSMAPGTETVTVFAPTDSTDQFSNGVVMVAFKGHLYCQWQSSAKDEDAPGTWVAYSRSSDGVNWTVPTELAASIDSGYTSSGGWWVNGDTLVAYLNTWPAEVSPRGGYTRYITSTDGLTWTDPEPVLMANGDTLNGIFEQDPDTFPGGRIISAAHFQPGLLVAPIYTDDPSGVRGWVRASFSNMSVDNNVSREIEPSWYLREDSAVVMTFRDQSGSYRRLAALSTDGGETWPRTFLTNMPDSRSKQSAGNLPGGEAFLVGNPNDDRVRIPLAITLSLDGRFFNTAYLLRKGGEGIQPLRYEGRFKRLGYHYPKSMIWQDHLYVAYATNKEDVEFTRVPLSSLAVDTATTNLATPQAANEGIKITVEATGVALVALPKHQTQGSFRIFSVDGRLLEQGKVAGGSTRIELRDLPIGTYLIQVVTPDEVKNQRFFRQ